MKLIHYKSENNDLEMIIKRISLFNYEIIKVIRNDVPTRYTEGERVNLIATSRMKPMPDPNDLLKEIL